MNSNNLSVLVTGGAGYIGSHTCLELINKGYNVIVIDNLINGNREALRRVEKMTGSEILFFNIDLRDADSLNVVFKNHSIDAVIHFAGYKAVGESVEKPLLYYSNNVSASITLLETMISHHVDKIVFSSSCTVYGKPKSIPVQEKDYLVPNNPYGRSKLVVERILQDSFHAIPSLSISILRYFNPIGAHPSGRIGEDPTGIPNNLMPFVSRVAAGQLNILKIFGNDYDTHDGTGVRDYIHVVDLAQAHIASLEMILGNNSSFEIYNLGTGKGYSVLDVVKTFEKVSGEKIPYIITDRRSGDIGMIFANPTKANEKLGWVAQRDLYEMCRDMWNWQVNNPNGYK